MTSRETWFPSESIYLCKILARFVRISSPGGVLLGILYGGVPPGSANPDSISYQKMSFSTPVFRPESIPFPISDQNGQSVYPSSDQKGLKTIPFGAAHTYMAYLYKGVFPPPPGFQVLFKGLCHEDIAALGQFCAEVISFCLLPLHKILL